MAEYEESTLKLTEVGGGNNGVSDQRALEKNYMNFWEAAEAFLERFDEPEVEEEIDHAAIAADRVRKAGPRC